jgi:hypothetical protein
VNITRNNVNILIMGLVCLSILSAVPVAGDQIFAPDYLWERGIASKTDPIEIADTHLGIAYRDDGTLDSQGHFTAFDRPDRFFETPGLNCSGLVVSVSRFLFDKNWTLEEVTRDRLGNSGADSPLGKDWDFGWDLIFNLTEGKPRRIIMPEPGNYTVEGSDGITLRGFDLHDSAAWQKVLSQMKSGRMYLGSISRPAPERGYRVLHYHVVLMLPDGKGGVWLYHATRRSHVHRMNVSTPQGMSRFMSQFKGSRGNAKKILIVEAMLPPLAPATEAASETGLPPTQQQVAGQEPTPAPTQETLPVMPLEARDTNRLQDAPSASGPSSPDTLAAAQSSPPVAAAPQNVPELVINHLSGRVFKSFPELVTQIPRFADDSKNILKFRFSNGGNLTRDVQIFLKTPDGDVQYKGQLAADADLSVAYPNDFSRSSSQPLKAGKYLVDVRVDGVQWCADLFEVAMPREARPKVLNVKMPATVQAGQTFTVRVEAQNQGAESDYGGITISTPDPSGLRLVSAKPGRIFGPGSTVLSVTTDKIRTKVPMAERWIDLWGESKVYDLNVQVQAGRPGTYPLYVRCALRGVNVKSSVVLMDPQASDAADQQGFPVQVHKITVR